MWLIFDLLENKKNHQLMKAGGLTLNLGKDRFGMSEAVFTPS